VLSPRPLTILGVEYRSAAQYRHFRDSCDLDIEASIGYLMIGAELVCDEVLPTPAALEAGTRFKKALPAAGFHLDDAAPPGMKHKYPSLDAVPEDRAYHAVLAFVAHPPAVPAWPEGLGRDARRDYWDALKRCSLTSIFPPYEGLELDAEKMYRVELKSSREIRARYVTEHALAYGESDWGMKFWKPKTRAEKDGVELEREKARLERVAKLVSELRRLGK
jgi:hypothetical protein